MSDEPTIPPKRRGNPNLVKGKSPYNTKRGEFTQWLVDHPTYERTSRRKSSEIVRRFLEEMVTCNEGVPQHKDAGKERLEKVLQAVYKTACNQQSKNQITAAQLLMLYAYGKPSLSEGDQDAIKKGGLTFVYVDRPAFDPEIPVATPALPEAPPDFIEAEIVE